jgi:hypothetical protein
MEGSVGSIRNKERVREGVMKMKTDLMSEIDSVLDAQADSRLDVVLSVVFGGYETEPAITDAQLNRYWEYGDFNVDLDPNYVHKERHGFTWTYSAGPLHSEEECTLSYDDDLGGYVHYCEQFTETVEVEEFITPYRASSELGAYRDGLMGLEVPRAVAEIGPEYTWDSYDRMWVQGVWVAHNMGQMCAAKINWED